MFPRRAQQPIPRLRFRDHSSSWAPPVPRAFRPFPWFCDQGSRLQLTSAYNSLAIKGSTGAFYGCVFSGKVPTFACAGLGWQISLRRRCIRIDDLRFAPQVIAWSLPPQTPDLPSPMFSGWVSQSCACSPRGSALYQVSVRRLVGLHSGFFQKSAHAFPLAVG